MDIEYLLGERTARLHDMAIRPATPLLLAEIHAELRVLLGAVENSLATDFVPRDRGD